MGNCVTGEQHAAELHNYIISTFFVICSAAIIRTARELETQRGVSTTL